MLLTSIAMNNCSNVRLEKTPEQASFSSLSLNQICTATPDSDHISKVLFLVDMSGSNFNGNDGNGVGTDPDKSYRAQIMRNLVLSNFDSKQIYYGFIGFGQATAVALINEGGDQEKPIFSNDRAKFNQALSAFSLITDQGATPYKAALKMAEQAIATDLLTNPKADKTHYAITLISDGAPTDYGQPFNPSAVLNDVKDITAMSSNVTFATLYYGPKVTSVDRAAVSLLKQIATDPGFFMDTTVSGRDQPLSSIVQLTQIIPNIVKRFMVVNLTSAPCDDGSMDVDSDADGLCDKDEINYNHTLAADPVLGPRMNGFSFNPTNRNSFGNVYNDYLNYMSFAYGWKLNTNCHTSSSTSHDLINDCEKNVIGVKKSVGPTLDWTQKMGSSADPYNYDSDGDGFLDGIELIFGRNLSTVLDYSSSLALIGDHRFDQILLEHRNPIDPDQATAYDPVFSFAGMNDQSQNCYSYKQTILPLYHTLPLASVNAVGFPDLAHAADENVILIYYIETPQDDSSGAGELHYAFQKIKFGQSPSLNLDSSAFRVYSPVRARVKN